MTSREFRILLLAAAAIFLAACGPRLPEDTSARRWQSADLRALEPPNTPDPAWDLVAAYARVTTTDLELRFDLLGSPAPEDYDLLVLVDTGAGGASRGSRLPIDQPSGMDWNLALAFPAYGAPRAFDAGGSPVAIRPRMIRSSLLDAAIVRISLSELAHLTSDWANPRASAFEAYLVRRGTTQVADHIGPLRVDGPAISATAPLLLAFWDSLPATTPAQALRRWDGAHTGPYGQRHGLSVLLDASAEANVPLALLDLRQPDALAALDALGGLPKVKDLAARKLLLLPELAAASPQDAATALAYSRQAAQQVGLPTSPFLYSSASALSKETTAAFASLKDTSRIVQWNATRLVPLPTGPLADDPQASEDGLTIPVREQLLNAALTGDPAPLTVLGGSLPTSPWGDSLVAGPTLDFIAGHPWIHPLRGEDLLALPARPGAPDCPDLLCLPDDPSSPVLAARAALASAPPGLFTELAWQAYFNLTAPAADPRLQALRAPYLGQVSLLVAASKWNAAPAALTDCSQDLNADGAAECALASTQTFLVIDPTGARLALAAGRLGGQPVEIIGPRSQRALGLGDPLDWRPERGLAADPQEIPGGFAGLATLQERCQAAARPGLVILTCPLNGARVVYRLVDGGFQVEMAAPTAFQAQVPLLLLDRHAWQPGWYARYAIPSPVSASEIRWGIRGGAQARVIAQGAALSMQHFAEGLAQFGLPEDPNTAVPPGAFLPFPMAVVDLHSAGNAVVAIYLENNLSKP